MILALIGLVVGDIYESCCKSCVGGKSLGEGGTMRTDIHIGMLIEGCNLHIGHVVEVDPQKDDVRFKSVFNGEIYGCSLSSCGVYELTSEEAQVRIRLYHQGGMEALSNFYFSGEDHVN